MGKKRAPHVSVPAYWVPGSSPQSPAKQISKKRIASIATRHLDPKQAANARRAAAGKGKKGGKGKGKGGRGKKKGGKH